LIQKKLHNAGSLAKEKNAPGRKTVGKKAKSARCCLLSLNFPTS